MKVERFGKAGPLKGVRVLEFAGIGPGPYAAMLLSDLGAEVLRIDRAGSAGAGPHEVTARGRASLALDLKDPAAVATCLELIGSADVLIEGFRPGVMERLGLGPDATLERNPALIYARMTGWGQDGPLALAAGHDLNYIAITGALAALGRPGTPPPPPLNLLGDFGGGSLFLVLGVLAALHERHGSGRGQVIDAAICDGTASLMGLACWMDKVGMAGPRGDNFLDGSAHYYRCYECADGKYVALGPIEPHFYAEMTRLLGEDLPNPPGQTRREWEMGGDVLEVVFRLKPRAEWCALLEGTDACFAPVMDLSEAPGHPHLAARSAYVEAFGVTQPAPAPRFSRTPGSIQGPPPAAGEGGAAMARDWGVVV
ncbi:MAG: CaiB/BaiF CoA transferase family protein [Pseudomonadota bacterium]